MALPPRNLLYTFRMPLSPCSSSGRLAAQRCPWRVKMRLGYERFYVMPQTAEEMSCRVCGSKCLVRREVHGPREFVTVTQKVHDVWDVFTCPHAGKAWHEKAVELAVAIDETPSKRVGALMREDLEDLLRENGVL